MKLKCLQDFEAFLEVMQAAAEKEGILLTSVLARVCCEYSSHSCGKQAKPYPHHPSLETIDRLLII